MKLVTLFVLTCPERISALASLDLRHCNILPEGVSFTLTVFRKTGSADTPAKVFLACFDQDKKLSVLSNGLDNILNYPGTFDPLSRFLFPISCLSHLDAPINRSRLQR